MTYSSRFREGKDLLVVLHGTGGDEHDLFPLAEQIAGGMAILSIRGNVMENGMNRYFRRLEDGTFDMEDLARRTKDLSDFISGFSRKIEGETCLLGYSNGANMAASLLVDAKVSKRAILLHPANIAFPPADLSSSQVLVTIGNNDTIVDPQAAERLGAAA